MLPDRLTWIDETNRGKHFYLEQADRCLFFSEYQAYGGYQASPTNQLIHNYKYTPTKTAANPGPRRYKESAISTIAAGLRRAMVQPDAEAYTWVPVPTSKIIGDPDYDDRLIRTLTQAFAGYHTDVRTLLHQTASTKADHSGGDRLTPDALYALLEIDQALLAGTPIRGNGIILFDDVLTSGKHFKCCTRRLRTAVPAVVPIIGVFVARCVFPDPAHDFEDLMGLT